MELVAAAPGPSGAPRQARSAGAVAATIALALAMGTVVAGPAAPGVAVAGAAVRTPAPSTGAHGPPGAGGPYPCGPQADGQISGADGDASVIGWLGNGQGVVACLGGSFYVQDGIDRTFGYGIYDDSPTTWTNADGDLPALVTAFHRDGASVAITNFADRVVVGGDPLVAVYSRVAVHNPTSAAVTLDPDPSPGLVTLHTAPDTVAPGGTADHDYVVAVDRFGRDFPWPSPQALASAGGFNAHFAHMRRFWDGQLDGIALVTTPDRQLDDAYRTGFIYTQIIRSGDDLNTGVNGYESEFSHDVIGILANLFTQGYFTDAHALLENARSVVGAQFQYDDGLWTYPWPWAIYLLKTGDLAFVKQNFATEGPAGSSEPSIEDTAHAIAAARTGPGGIMEATDDIDTDGYWTVDDFEALMGLAAYRYLAQQVGDRTEEQWAAGQYASLLAATNRTLSATIDRYHLGYLPCSMVAPNTADRCDDPEDANWAAPFLFGRWAWDGYLFGAPRNGPGLALIDATYDYGFGRLAHLLPAGTLGGYPDDYYTTAYDAGYGSWGLASRDHRSQGIESYQFLISRAQSGPYSWWESSGPPDPSSPWTGSHPGAGQGASPHAWGMADANLVLLDSIAAQRSDGSLVVGRGVPRSWIHSGATVAVTGFPTTDGHRLGLRISASGRTVTLALGGARPSGPVLFELPVFVDDVARASAGTVDEATGIVTVPPGVATVAVTLER